MSDRLEAERRADARIAYQVAAARWAHEGTLLWQKFNAMLIANSVILSASVMAPLRDLWPARVIFSIAGVALCLFWYLITQRAFARHRFWVGETYRAEGSLLAVAAVHRGHDQTNDEIGRVRYHAYCVILLFVGLYLCSGGLWSQFDK